MIRVSEVLAELRARGVRIEPRPHGGVRLVPARLIDPDLLNRIREHKRALLGHLHAERDRAAADKALALLNRLRCYALSTGHMPLARDLAIRLSGLTEPERILVALQAFESELVALGGQ